MLFDAGHSPEAKETKVQLLDFGQGHWLEHPPADLLADSSFWAGWTHRIRRAGQVGKRGWAEVHPAPRTLVSHARLERETAAASIDLDLQRLVRRSSTLRAARVQGSSPPFPAPSTDGQVQKHHLLKRLPIAPELLACVLEEKEPYEQRTL